MVKSNNGFTLMELIVAVAIVAILAVIAVPNYTDKIIKTQVNEALPLADIAKLPVAATWAATKSFPEDNASAGLPIAEKIVNNLVQSISIESGAIHITFGNHVNQLLQGKVLTLRPAVIEDAPVVPVVWVCGLATAPGNMTIKGNNKTDIPVRYLPIKCR
jgi:type IV pilus assembly protein PilA